MSHEITFRCDCGEVEGRLLDQRKKTCNRVTCYCDDCQTFAHHLDKGDSLNSHGGTSVWQTTPNRIEFTAGFDKVTCLKLSRKRPRPMAYLLLPHRSEAGVLLTRKFACPRSFLAVARKGGTPFGNTVPKQKIAFVSVFERLLDFQDGPDANQIGGRSLGGIQGRFAKGDKATLDAHQRAPFSVIWNFVGLAIGAKLRGEHKKSPLYDPETGRTRVKPHILTEDEVSAAIRRRDAKP